MNIDRKKKFTMYDLQQNAASGVNPLRFVAESVDVTASPNSIIHTGVVITEGVSSPKFIPTANKIDELPEKEYDIKNYINEYNELLDSFEIKTVKYPDPPPDEQGNYKATLIALDIPIETSEEIVDNDLIHHPSLLDYLKEIKKEGQLIKRSLTTSPYSEKETIRCDILHQGVLIRMRLLNNRTIISIFYGVDSYKYANEFSTKIKKIIKPKIYEKEYSINFINVTAAGYELVKIPVDISNVNEWEYPELNYGKDFNNFYNTMKYRLTNNTNGLFLLHGVPGTGKSYFIKHLMSELKNQNTFIYMPASIMNNISDPGFNVWLINKMSAEKLPNPVFIIEEAEKLIESRNTTSGGNGIANLLNLTDGILNDIMKIKVICTFNTSLDRIDAALKRPGRLSMEKEFTELSYDETLTLLNKLKISADKMEKFENKNYALSEIYAKLANDDIIMSKDIIIEDGLGFITK